MTHGDPVGRSNSRTGQGHGGPGGGGGGATLTIFKYTVSSNTTVFTGNDDDNQSLTYTVGSEQVFLNGVKLVDAGKNSYPRAKQLYIFLCIIIQYDSKVNHIQANF